MITDLSIRNFALIENSELTFSSGLNILSGETGAGKSILIEALSVLLGNRASLEQIRTGMNEASVSATITLDNNRDIYNYSNIDMVINKIKEYDLLDKCYIISFMAGCLEYVRKFYPNVSIQWLCTSTVVQDLDWCIKNRFDIDVHYSYMTKEIVDKCHANNLKVNIWTLNDESLLEKYLDMGVDMITSDFIIK